MEKRKSSEKPKQAARKEESEMATSSAKQAAIKDDLTIVRDIVITVRDQMPDIGKEEMTTRHQRRAIRKAILKLLACWSDMNEASDLGDSVKIHRKSAIEGMMRSILRFVQVPVWEDGATDWEQEEDDESNDVVKTPE